MSLILNFTTWYGDWLWDLRVEQINEEWDRICNEKITGAVYVEGKIIPGNVGAETLDEA